VERQATSVPPLAGLAECVGCQALAAQVEALRQLVTEGGRGPGFFWGKHQ
jgi:hypothetical protein